MRKSAPLEASLSTARFPPGGHLGYKEGNKGGRKDGRKGLRSGPDVEKLGASERKRCKGR